MSTLSEGNELVSRKDVLDAFFDIAGNRWLDGPDIQRAFRKVFGDIFYKNAMEDLRLHYRITHEYYTDQNGKKYWRYLRHQHAGRR